MSAERYDHKDRLNRMNPAAQRVELGDLVDELIDKVNALSANQAVITAKLDADAGVTDEDYADEAPDIAAMKTLAER